MNREYNLDDDPYAAAATAGCVVVEPESGELQLDIDLNIELAKAGKLHRFNRVMACLERNDITATSEFTESKSGNTHMTVQLDELVNHPEHGGPLMRIALQAIMGSDPVREMLGILRLVQDTKRAPTLFFEVPNAERFTYDTPKRGISFGALGEGTELGL